MIRLWWVISYLVNYHKPSSRNLSGWFSSEVNKYDFLNYLVVQKKFRENWRDTLIRWLYFIPGKEIPASESGLARARKRWREIEDVINMGISRDLIQAKGTLGNTFFSTDYRARNFLKLLPFFVAVLKEYGPIYSFVFGGFGGAILIPIFRWATPVIQENIENFVVFLGR